MSTEIYSTFVRSMISDYHMNFSELPEDYRSFIVEFIEQRYIHLDEQISLLNMREAANIRMVIKNRVRSFILEHFAEQRRQHTLIISYTNA